MLTIAERLAMAFFVHFVLFLAGVLLRLAIWLLGQALRLLVLLASALVRVTVLLARALWWLTPRVFVLLRRLDVWTIDAVAVGVACYRRHRAIRATQR